MKNINFHCSFKNIRKVAFNVAFGYSMGKFAACAAQSVINGAIKGTIKGFKKITAPKEGEKDA